MRAMVLDVTPQEEAEVPAPQEAVVADAAATPEPEVVAASFDPALAEEGEKVFRKCKSCHQVGADAKNRVGPILNGIVGKPAGAVEGFRYSKPMAAAGEEGLIWTEAELIAFLAKPKAYMKGTKMAFAGLRKDDDLLAVVEYLKSFEE